MPVACKPNGPYFLTGATLKGADGGDLPVGEGAALCRCGGSNNKPFCDGTHGKIGFSIAPFSLVTQAGQRISERDLDGRIHIASFIYTRCSAICPLVVAQLAGASFATR